jgi:hypothetical protein
MDEKLAIHGTCRNISVSPKCFSRKHSGVWRGGRVVDGGGLENHCTRKGTGGSNPSLSAILPRSTGAKMRYLLPLVVLVAPFFVGCGSPASPSTEKALTVFVDRDYGGSWHDVTGDWANLNSVGGPCNQVTTANGSGGTTTSGGNWDDCVSSIRLSPGWVATGYRDRNFSGPTFEITQDIPNLRNIAGPCDHGFDDCLSSIRVSRR